LVFVSLVLGLLLSDSAFGAETVRIGFMGPLSGINAPNGKDMLEGFQFFFEQAGYQCGQRKVELVIEDCEANPNVALTRLRKLIERDRVKVFAGVQWMHVGYALAPVIDKERLPTVFMTTPDDLTKRRPAKFIIRVSASCSQTNHPLGEYASKVLGYRRATTIAFDNAWGHESVGGFHQVFKDNGGEVVQKLWAPINVLDFAAYLSQIRRDVDVVFATFAGAAAIRFVSQYAEYGLKGKIPLLASGFMMDESNLRSMGDEAVGIISAVYWSPTLENSASRTFVKSFMAKFGKTPSIYTMSMYSGARWIWEGLKATEGKSDDPEKLLAAIRQASQTIEDPRGPITLDEYNNPTQNVYIFRVEKRDGKLENRAIYMYPMVSQFWKYQPNDFLKRPLYSREYPAPLGQ
jgi:branched-chain amino acid transport system substrate-binding protein